MKEKKNNNIKNIILQVPINEENKNVGIDLKNITRSIEEIRENKELKVVSYDKFSELSRMNFNNIKILDTLNEFEITVENEEKPIGTLDNIAVTYTTREIAHKSFILEDYDLNKRSSYRIEIEFSDTDEFTEIERKNINIIIDDVKYNIYKMHKTWELIHGENEEWSLYNGNVKFYYCGASITVYYKKPLKII